MNEIPPSLRRSCREGQRHFTRIGEAVATLPVDSAVLDGEAVILRPDSACDFEALRSRQAQAEAILVAYDASWSMTARTCATRLCVAHLRWSRMPNLIGNVRPFKAMHCDSRKLATVERRLSTRSALHPDFTCTRARPATAGNYPSPIVAAGTTRPTSGRQVEAPFAPRQSVQ